MKTGDAVMLESNSACVVCMHVFERERPALLVMMDLDGIPQYLCGRCHPAGPQDGRLVGYGHLLNHDPSLAELGALEFGYRYERPSIEHPWFAAPPQDFTDIS